MTGLNLNKFANQERFGAEETLHDDPSDVEHVGEPDEKESHESRLWPEPRLIGGGSTI